MEKNEPIKVKLSTVILSILIICLVVVIVYFLYKNNELKKEKEQGVNEIQTLQGKVEELENNIKSIDNVNSNTISNTANTIPENNTKSNTTNTITNKNTTQSSNTSTTTKNDNTTSEYKEITSELGEKEIFKFIEFEKNNNKYILKGEIWKTPYTISDTEYKDIIKKGKMTFEGKEYLVKKSEEHSGEYGLYPKEHKNAQWYRIRKQDSKVYIIESVTEYNNVYQLKNNYVQITLDGNTKCVYSVDSYDEKTDTVANVFSKKLYFGGGIGACFKFSFKNGKCVSVNEIVTGH